MPDEIEIDRSMLVSPHKQKSIFSSNPLLKRNDTSFIEGNEKNEKLLLQFQENSGDNPVYKETTEKKIHSTRTGVVHQLLITLAISLLTIGSGMPMGYTAIFLPQIQNTSDPLRMDISMASWFASVHSLASPIGSFASGPLMDRIGRRHTLIVAMIPLIMGWTLIATANSHTLLLIGRFLAGLSGGFMGAPSQILIAECADPFLRGMLINFSYVSYSIGILLVYVLGAFLPWRYVAWCGIIIPLISIVNITASPESPTWLVRNGYKDRAAKVLIWLRGDELVAQRELIDIVKRYEHEKYEQQLEKESIWTACSRLSVFKPLLIVSVFQILLILTGTYLIVFYSVEIIAGLGTSVNSTTAAVCTAVMRLCITILCCFAFYFMKRRSIYVTAGLGSTISGITLATYLLCRDSATRNIADVYVGCILLLIYTATNTGFMIAPGFMIGELLPAKIRGRIAGYIYAMFNISFFALAKVFPHLLAIIGIGGAFWMFSLASLFATALIYFLVPETKGKSLGEIEDYFSQSNWIVKSHTKTHQMEASINGMDKC